MNDYFEQERRTDTRDGCYGLWHVSSMMNEEKLVTASSASEALDKAGIPEWQNPTAAFVRPIRRG